MTNTVLARLREWMLRFRGTIRATRTDRDLAEELRSHLELAAADAERRGGNLEKHLRAARIRAGGIEQALERTRDQRGLPWLEDLMRDLRHGVQLLRRSPAFAAVAVISLALGIGANAAVFSFADALLLRPLPVPRSGEVLTVGATEAFGGSLVASYREYVDIRDRSRTIDGLVAFTASPAAMAVDAHTPPRLTMGMLVSANFFRVMGVVPEVGRDFRSDEDEVPGRDAVIVLSHDFWRREVRADRSVLGRSVRLNGIEMTVIGVAPEGFTGMDQYTRHDFYVPLIMWTRLNADLKTNPLEARDFRGISIKARLKPGVTRSQAQAELSAIGRDLERAYPDTNRNRILAIRTELENRVAQSPPVAMMLAMLAALAIAVLMVACANVAGLLTSRAPVRAREIALRMAIGAGRLRVIRQLIAESLLIAVAGGIVGLAVAYAGVALFRQIRFPTDLPIAPSFELDRRAMIVSLVVALTSVVFFGVAPAIRSARADLTGVMKASDVPGISRRRPWGRALLVTGQVAASVVLLVVATFFYRGFQQQLVAGPGFRMDRVLLMAFNPPLVGYGEAQTLRFFGQLAERAKTLAGVTDVALASSVPMDGFPARIAVVPEGFEFPVGTDSVMVGRALVDERYFAVLGMPILAGRVFRETDAAGMPDVAIVNEQFAGHYWPGQNSIGRRFRLNDGGGRWLEVVGLARNAKYGFLTEQQREFVYLPYRQHPPRSMFLFARSAGDPSSLVTPLREMVQRLDANQPIYNVRTFDELYRMRVVVVLDVINSLIGAMGMIGLTLAIVGLYGLVAYGAGRRTREIGVRMAIGAGRSAVLRMVLRQGLALSVAGLAIGLTASLGADRLLRTIFTGGASRDTALDPVPFVMVAAAVLAVTVVAAYLPARRASRINPIEALRCD